MPRHWRAGPRVAGLLGVVSVLCTPGAIFAQVAETVVEDPVRIPAAVALRVAASPVALAYGNAGLLLNDADVLFYNPGMLTTARGVMASVQRHGPVGTSGAIASTQMFGAYGVAVGVRFADWQGTTFSYGDALRRGLGALGERGERDASSLALSIGTARAIGPVRVGLSGTYVRETYAGVYDESSLVDVGVVLPLGRTSAALSLQRLGGAMTLPGLTDESPWQATLGYGGWNYPLSTFVDVGGTVQLSVDESGRVRSAGGGELAYVPIEGLSLAARVGLRTPYLDQSRVTAGLGVTLDRYSLDYAVEPVRDGRTAHRAGVRIR